MITEYKLTTKQDRLELEVHRKFLFDCAVQIKNLKLMHKVEQASKKDELDYLAVQVFKHSAIEYQESFMEGLFHCAHCGCLLKERMENGYFKYYKPEHSKSCMYKTLLFMVIDIEEKYGPYIFFEVDE